MDMVIHSREHDLVIGTFGRAFYVLDDIRPLREMVKKGTALVDKAVYLFTPPDAYLSEIQQPTGPRFDADAVYNGQNRPSGALITYVINKPAEKKEAKSVDKTSVVKKDSDVKSQTDAEIKKDSTAKAKYDSLTLQVFNAKGDLIRTMKEKTPEDNGVNRMTWGMNEKGVRSPSRESEKSSAERSGISVLPGTYKLRLIFGGQKDSVMITVKDDPRYTTSAPVLEARYKMLKDLDQLTTLTAKASEQLRESLSLTNELEKKMSDTKRDDLKDAIKKAKAMKDSINALFDFMLGKEDKRQGIVYEQITPISFIGTAQFYIGSSRGPVNATDERAFKQAQDKTTLVLNKVNSFFATTWKTYRTEVEKISISSFKDYLPLKQ